MMIEPNEHCLKCFLKYGDDKVSSESGLFRESLAKLLKSDKRTLEDVKNWFIFEHGVSFMNNCYCMMWVDAPEDHECLFKLELILKGYIKDDPV